MVQNVKGVISHNRHPCEQCQTGTWVFIINKNPSRWLFSTMVGLQMKVWKWANISEHTNMRNITLITM